MRMGERQWGESEGLEEKRRTSEEEKSAQETSGCGWMRAPGELPPPARSLCHIHRVAQPSPEEKKDLEGERKKKKRYPNPGAFAGQQVQLEQLARDFKKNKLIPEQSLSLKAPPAACREERGSGTIKTLWKKHKDVSAASHCPRGGGGRPSPSAGLGQGILAAGGAGDNSPLGALPGGRPRLPLFIARGAPHQAYPSARGRRRGKKDRPWGRGQE